MIYKCGYENCGLIFNRPSKLKRHEDVHAGVRSFICDKENCGKSYSSGSHLIRHQKNIHGEKKLEEKVVYVCTKCSAYFKSAASLQKHENKHVSLPMCKHCNMFFRDLSRFEKHMTKHTTKGELKLQPKTNLKIKTQREPRSVSSASFLQCSECGLVFKSSRNLKEHKKSIHSSSCTLYLCGEQSCSKVFFYKRNLRNHVRYTHLNILFECNLPGCSQKFKHKKSLKRHLQLHEEKYHV